jgi:hypothetical protein
MKDFDEVRAQRAAEDRSFQLGGETFAYRVNVRPETLLAFEVIDETDDSEEKLALLDRAILSLIEPDGDAPERWRQLREREEDAVSLRDLRDVAGWLVEQASGRPLAPPSPSTPGPVAMRPSSTGASSSRAAKASRR